MSSMDKLKKENAEEQNRAIEKSAAGSPDDEVPPPMDDGHANPDMKTVEKMKSENSLRTSEDGVTRGREINDTLIGRLLYLQWAFISIIIEILLIYFLYLLHSKAGVTIPIGGQIFEQTVPVILELWMHIVYIFTDLAMSKGLAAYFAYELTQKRGYSLIVCGFIQAGLFAKIQFSGLLNFRSKYKKVVSRASILWLVHVLFLILTFFASTAIAIETTRYDSGTLLCIEYGQDGSPVDRGWPTIEVQQGVAEFAFGTSFGHLRSEEKIPYSTLITPPQLIDACTDNTNIRGKGFTTKIFTHCECSPSTTKKDIEIAGISSKYSQDMLDQYKALNGGPGLVNSIHYNTNITIYTMISGGYLCGGDKYDHEQKTVSVCYTKVYDHRNAFVFVSYMNDGITVRSAPRDADVLEYGTPAKMDWLYAATMNIFGNVTSTQKLPGFYPGTVNPLLWWGTPNLQVVSTAYLDVGIETTIALLLKSGITRTYSVKGNTCIRNAPNTGKTNLHIGETGYRIGLVFAVFELFLSVGSILACIPWFLNKDPVIPAIRLVSDRTYFNIMLCKNSTGNLLRMIGSTADRTDIWPKLDMEVRVGENIQTVSDPESGEIIMDKPKLVTHLSWTKCY